MNINEITVGEMAAEEPKAIEIFKELGIDFCCGGGISLSDALREKGVSPEQFAERLEKLKAGSGHNREINFQDMKPASLADYIVVTHHEYLRKALPETYALFLKVLRVHGAHHPELYPAFKLFGNLKTELEQHLIREETILFPEIAELNEEKVQKLAKEIKEEHESAGELLDQLQAVTNNYALPSDACASFTNLYASLKEIEDDIHQHIHLENNILFKSIA